ncbi:hypothetical protein Pmani_024228 [Petrolisthes manimaculis]|uniref:Nudix hydrolase domain-containing protein n=1 Tax=Petrolisthes manimaculis TaxID=1843537 RepID=A0AAE1P979_9EUCA|nr:hypothetical protein Pmani_024228 [Petrolisthes manimaculis]
MLAGKVWKEAASLLIIGRTTSHLGTKKKGCGLVNGDYRVVFLKRNTNNSFMPNMYVFPGGSIECSDFSSAWYDVFNKCGYSQSKLEELRTDAPPPRLYRDKPNHFILPELGFRIAAIRETFEESGVLLAKHLPENCLTLDDINKWRDIIHNDASQFVTFFREVGGCPAVWDLHEWISYLTPTHVGNRRYDTAFYITFMDKLPKVVFDETEMSGLQISSPQSLLEKWHRGEFSVGPPQLHELQRLLNFPHFDDLKRFAEVRGRKGMDEYFNVRILTPEGIIVVLPGDDLYPTEPDYLGDEPQLEMDCSMEELRKSANKLHRYELRPGSNMELVVNIDPKFGHKRPVNYNQVYKNPLRNRVKNQVKRLE